MYKHATAGLLIAFLAVQSNPSFTTSLMNDPLPFMTTFHVTELLPLMNRYGMNVDKGQHVLHIIPIGGCIETNTQIVRIACKTLDWLITFLVPLIWLKVFKL